MSNTIVKYCMCKNECSICLVLSVRTTESRTHLLPSPYHQVSAFQGYSCVSYSHCHPRKNIKRSSVYWYTSINVKILPIYIKSTHIMWTSSQNNILQNLPLIMYAQCHMSSLPKQCKHLPMPQISSSSSNFALNIEIWNMDVMSPHAKALFTMNKWKW